MHTRVLFEWFSTWQHLFHLSNESNCRALIADRSCRTAILIKKIAKKQTEN